MHDVCGAVVCRYASTYQQAAKTLSSLLRAHGALQVGWLATDSMLAHIQYACICVQICDWRAEAQHNVSTLMHAYIHAGVQNG